MTSEQDALIRKAKESLQASLLLKDQGFFDFAVSRAYYAMFYLAEALLLKQGLAYSKHSAVIAAFGQHLVKTGQVPGEFHRKDRRAVTSVTTTQAGNSPTGMPRSKSRGPNNSWIMSLACWM